MSRTRPKIDHLQRLGLQPHPESAEDGSGPIAGIEILARRSRKEWKCAAEACQTSGVPIGIDTLYVELAESISRYTGKTLRYHIPCAILNRVVRRLEEAVDVGNNRRQAILATRARAHAS